MLELRARPVDGLLLPLTSAASNVFGRVCLSVCLVDDPTFDSLDRDLAVQVCALHSMHCDVRY